MQIKSNLSTLMGSKRYSIKDVHGQTDLLRGIISSVYNDHATRIDFDTISKLCTLFERDVYQLLVKVPDNQDQN